MILWRCGKVTGITGAAATQEYGNVFVWSIVGFDILEWSGAMNGTTGFSLKGIVLLVVTLLLTACGGGGGGGGGGGSGGDIILLYHTMVLIGTIQTNGGVGGAGGVGVNTGGSGTAGSNGLTGYTFKIKI